MTTAARLAPIQLESVQRIYDDGNHNAFTDLVRFRDRLFLAFRSSPTSHGVVDDSCIVILTSANDGASWRKSHATEPMPGRDLRDPHFLVLGDTLFVYCGAWSIDDAGQRTSMADMQGYALWTTDGVNWHGPTAMKGTQGYFVWRAAAFEDRAFLCGRRIALEEFSDGPQVIESVLLTSGDGHSWRPVGLFQEIKGNETAFLFEPDGRLIAVSRRNREPAQLCRSRPPYRQWQRIDLARFVGGPMLARWGERYLVGGRKLDPAGNRTILSWLAEDQLIDQLELPSGGDNSYPGFVALDDSHGLVSYYSSHEGSGSSVAPAHIYLARIRV